MGINEQLLVSIGLPVFNGEKGLESAINSLLEQDYSNFEIIISDNGSTDSTPKICKTFVEKDRRIKYFRSEENRGAIWNFNRVFELSSGKYFMWAAADDLREVNFISSCVNKLELNQQAVLCSPHTKVFIEGNNEVIYTATIDSFTNKTNLIDRYKETIKSSPVFVIYGVFRSSVVKRTNIMRRGVIAADVCFMREMSLYGTFIQVPEKLFSYYGRENWNRKEQDYRVFFGNKSKPFWYLPFIVVLLASCKDILYFNTSLSLKIRLLSILLLEEIIRINKRIVLLILGKITNSNTKSKIGFYLHRKFYNTDNFKIYHKAIYYKRIILPQLRW